MATAATELEERRARRAAPTQRRGEVLLFLGPCVAYLVAVSVYPLVVSLVRSFEQYDSRANTWTWIGLGNYRELVTSSEFWATLERTAIFTFGAVALEVALGTALAFFFNQRLRGATFVRGIVILPMLLTPVVVGLMWRALLNPDWGMLDWLAARLGFENVQWLSDPDTALRTLIAVDLWQWTPFVFVIVFARLQALPEDVFEAAAVDGAGFFQRLRYLTLPLLMPAIVFAGIFRAIDAFRTFDLVYGLTNGGPGQSTSTLSFEAFQNGFQFFRYGYSSAIAYVMVIFSIIGVTLLFRFVRVRRAEI